MIKLSGVLEYSMGGFLCLRGYASFKMLSGISEPNADVQRQLIASHKGEMARFLNDGEYRFFPEVILSLTLTDGKSLFDEVEQFHTTLRGGATWNKNIGNINFSISQNETKNIVGQYESTPRIERINIAHIRFDETQLKLTRIDGNHRLSAADEVKDDFTIPYCLLLFRNPNENDQYSRAIFHNINAKQIPLNLEENLKVILNSDGVFSDEKLKKDPSFGWEYYLARQSVKNFDITYFPVINTYISAEINSFFVQLYKFLLQNNKIKKDDSAVEIVRAQLVDIEKALEDSKIVATTNNLAVIGALSYYKLVDESKYRGFLSWVKKNNIGDVKKLHMEDVINLYDKIFQHVPKKVFLARWYPSAEQDGQDEAKRADARVNAVKKVCQELNLDLTDLGTCVTGTFDIRKRMYENIKDCDIFIADISGARHNVMIEIGYALKHVDTGRMIFYFQESEKIKNVPFDVSHLAYDKIVDSADINTKTKARIQTILNQAQNGEI